MKIAVIGAMAGITLCARDVKPKDQNTVTVYIEYEAASSRGLYAAMKMAAKMFAAAGVRIMWHFGEPSYRELDQDRPIVIRTSFGAPASERPGALAYALPYQGFRIVVYYDRIKASHPEAPIVVLAHVLVHEITHILQGVTRHSATGVMRATWTAKEYDDMLRKPLSFTAEDIEWIRIGLAARWSRILLDRNTSVRARVSRCTENVDLGR